jgi:hypothetical protein
MKWSSEAYDSIEMRLPLHCPRTNVELTGTGHKISLLSFEVLNCIERLGFRSISKKRFVRFLKSYPGCLPKLRILTSLLCSSIHDTHSQLILTFHQSWASKPLVDTTLSPFSKNSSKFPPTQYSNPKPLPSASPLLVSFLFLSPSLPFSSPQPSPHSSSSTCLVPP